MQSMKGEAENKQAVEWTACYGSCSSAAGVMVVGHACLL
jgi:hypothetical protein